LEAESFVEVAVVVIDQCLDEVSGAPGCIELEAAVMCVAATDEAFEGFELLIKGSATFMKTATRVQTVARLMVSTQLWKLNEDFGLGYQREAPPNCTYSSKRVKKAGG
jgi:hypothetical protein